jgi:phage N-6-adenine-methyltransferase
MPMKNTALEGSLDLEESTEDTSIVPVLDETDFWETPPNLFQPLLSEFGPFDLDSAADSKTAKASLWFGTQNDGSFIDSLKQDWSKFQKVWCNPPFSKKGKKDEFVRKAYEASLLGTLTVMVIPVKTDTASFHKYIYKKTNVEIRFLKGRPKFLKDGKVQGTGRSPIMVVVFHPHRGNTLTKLAEGVEIKNG